ncbi:MAG: DUF1992 domain-containing protein [Thermogemmatispora sp.]|uniref:DnaJ family domain-containing protein n=1 Tax=Thermogemmatispora sp. TaxID=1968838 RepID=UPI0019E7B71C|nr:DUF1992 domain-containing protein [Thermogemmatispora sp.]MBE3568004.1 DUF1992 domain-containing protein [Thermogemmatispora sp.]
MDLEKQRSFYQRQQRPEATQSDGERIQRGYDERRFRDFVEDQIREAQERGVFDHLPGMGKPLQLDENPYAREKELAYHLLKSNGFAPQEIELAKEIRSELQQVEARLARLRERRQRLARRRVPPFPSEKRAFNTALAQALRDYEATLRELNRKILTFSLMVPPAMHMNMVDVDSKVQAFRESCPPFPL